MDTPGQDSGEIEETGADTGPATDTETDDAPRVLNEDEIVDLITGETIKLKGNEEVRQRILSALYSEYGFRREDMERDFPIVISSVGQRKTTKKADIAIFEPDAVHTMANLRRVVICKPAPKETRTVTKIRTHEQAEKDLGDLQALLGTETTPKAEYGMWTNGLDFFFLRKKEVSVFTGAVFEKCAGWPRADDTFDQGAASSLTRLRRGESAMLKTAFRRCHNYIHGNEGMPKDAAFWQFLYLIFTKMYDENESLHTRRDPQFYAHPQEPYEEEGRKAIRGRIEPLFEEVKKKYDLFTARDELQLSDHALAFIVSELAPYTLTGTDADVKGLAYQELVGTNLRGDRGQYFTPPGAVKLMVDILDPKVDETVLDPACGTGGFLRETLNHLLRQWRREAGTEGVGDTREQLLLHQDRLQEYSNKHLFGADFDPFLVRAASMSVMMLTGKPGNIFNMDSLAFPHGHLSGVKEAMKSVLYPLGRAGGVSVLMTNPPFGTDIKIVEAQTLAAYQDGVARSWSRDKETGAVVAGAASTAVAPEQLFIQRAVEWVRPHGRIGIVLPNGILSNPGPADQGIRQWILRHCWVLGSVELPVEAFVHDANVNVLTSLLFLKKKTTREMEEEALTGQRDYPVFMAVAEKVGIDRRGNDVYKRRPDGEIILELHRQTMKTKVNDVEREVSIPRWEKAIDNDLPEIGKAYHEFRRKYGEPDEYRKPSESQGS